MLDTIAPAVHLIGSSQPVYRASGEIVLRYTGVGLRLAKALPPSLPWEADINVEGGRVVCALVTRLGCHCTGDLSQIRELIATAIGLQADQVKTG